MSTSDNKSSRFSHSAFHGSPIQIANLREAALIDGLSRLAARYGVSFKHLRINANGDFDLATTGRPYGPDLARILTSHGPRCGTGFAVLCEESNWCYMNHFHVQHMLDENLPPPLPE